MLLHIHTRELSSFNAVSFSLYVSVLQYVCQVRFVCCCCLSVYMHLPLYTHGCISVACLFIYMLSSWPAFRPFLFLCLFSFLSKIVTLITIIIIICIFIFVFPSLAIHLKKEYKQSKYSPPQRGGGSNGSKIK